MRVFVVVHGFPPDAQGGSEVYACAHARGLARAGDEVLVFTREADRSRAEYAVRSEKRDGVHIVRVNNTFLKTRTFEESYRNPEIAAIAARAIDRFRPDIAHIHHLTCLSTDIVSELSDRGIPSLMTLHDYWLMCHRGQLLDLDFCVCTGPGTAGECDRCVGSQVAVQSVPAVMAAVRKLVRMTPSGVSEALSAASQAAGAIAPNGHGAGSRRRTAHMRRIAGQVSGFFAPSAYLRDRFIDFGLQPDRIGHSPYGFDHAPFAQTNRRAWRGKSSPLRLGFLGTLMASKAPHVLLEACRGLLPDAVTVDLIGAYTPYHGDDAYRHRLAPLLAQNGVRKWGSLPHDRVPEALSSIDVLVVPSVWPENSPLVIREAFLAGVPVIASHIGGIPELVTNERNGLLFEPGSVDGLRHAIERLLDEPMLLEHLRQGLPAVRTIDDDVSQAREVYATHIARSITGRGQSTAPARLAAVVLNHRTPDQTLLAVRSLLASRRPLDDIVVVDNDATESVREVVAGLNGGIGYVHTGGNLGFSGGVNVGIRHSLERGADAVLLVNSDLLVPPDCVGELERVLRETPDAGIVGPVVAARSAPGAVASLGISYDIRTGRMRHREVGARLDSRAAAVVPVDAIGGCLALIKRDVFEAIGLFDEDYFFTFEDIDFCLRARGAGFLSLVAGRATAYHEGGGTLRTASPERIYFATRNHLMLASRATPAATPVAHAGRVVSILALNLAHAVIAEAGSLPERLAAMARGARDYLAGRHGAA
jgi:GT2 family glycosyltransferase/glycosyltransferase involved in cell wall biosynthesis